MLNQYKKRLLSCLLLLLPFAALADMSISMDPEIYFTRGNVLGKRGEYDKAIKNFTQANKLNPKYVEAYQNRAYAWEKKGNLDQALRDYNRAIQIHPNEARLYNQKGIVLIRPVAVLNHHQLSNNGDAEPSEI